MAPSGRRSSRSIDRSPAACASAGRSAGKNASASTLRIVSSSSMIGSVARATATARTPVKRRCVRLGRHLRRGRARRPLLFIEWYAGRDSNPDLRFGSFGQFVPTSPAASRYSTRHICIGSSSSRRVTSLPTRFTCSRAATWRLRRGASWHDGLRPRRSELPRIHWPQSTADDVGSHRARLARAVVPGAFSERLASGRRALLRTRSAGRTALRR